MSLRRFLPVLGAAAVCAAILGPAAAKERSDQLVILSTTDVKGKTSPCGCSTPKGGLSRQASYADSVRAEFSQVLWVDNGGFFPEVADRRDVATFLIESMQSLKLDAVGIGERDLAGGAAFLVSEAKRTGLPVTSANLLDARTRKPLVAPHLIKKVGQVKVGVFALMSADANLGPARESLAVDPPAAAAKRAVAGLRKAGADVVVLLSQLGKLGSEDLVAAVEGIDAVIVGHETPLLQRGRLIKSTVACYGGEQGQYMCRTQLTLNAQRKVVTGEASAVMLSPEVGERPDVLERVKAFEVSAAPATPAAPHGHSH